MRVLFLFAFLLCICAAAFADDVCDCDQSGGFIKCIVGQSRKFLDVDGRVCVIFKQDFDCNQKADYISKYCMNDEGLLIFEAGESILESD